MTRIKPPVYRLLCERCKRTVGVLCDGSLLVVAKHNGHYHVTSYSAATMRGLWDSDFRRKPGEAVTLACAECELPAARARCGGIEFTVTHAGEQHRTSIPLALVVRLLEEQVEAGKDARP